MPNYKSKFAWFSDIAEMQSLALDNTDEDGLFFAVGTDTTNFKIVTWRKNSTATINNELVYSANGPGRWHVLPVGEANSKELLTVVGDTLPGSINAGIDLIAQKKTDGTKELKVKFDGIFEDLLGGSGTGVNVAYYHVDTEAGEHIFFDLPSPANPSDFSFAVVNIDTDGYYSLRTFYLLCWIPSVGYRPLSDKMYKSGLPNFRLGQGAATIGDVRHKDWLNSAGIYPDTEASNPRYSTQFYIWDGEDWCALLTNDDNGGVNGVYAKVSVNSGLITQGFSLEASDIPSLSTSKITSGTFDITRIPIGTTSTTVARGDHTHVVSLSTLSGVGLGTPVSGQVLGFNGFFWTNVDVPSGSGSGTVTLTGDITGTGTGTIATTLANTGTAGTYTKVTTDAKGRVLSGASLIASDIPSLDTGKIATGIFDITRIPNLSTSKITSGTFDISFIPTGTTSTTVALGNHNHAFSSLSDVSLTSPSNGQILSFDSATSQWKNTTLPAGTGAVNSVDGAFGDVILTNTYQAKSNELTAIAGLTDTTGYIKKTGDGTYILDNNVSGGVTSVDGLTGIVSLVNTYQTKSNELTALAGLADTVGFIKKTADGTYIIEDIAGGASGVASVDGLTGTVILSDKYLSLLGGTVSGSATFSANTPSTSTTTGAVKVSNGGLAVAGSGYFGGDLSHNGYLKKNGVSSTGWTSMTGEADNYSPIDTSTATLSQIAKRLKGIQDALSSLGIFDATGGDIYFGNVVLYLKADGTDGSTSIVDSSPIPKILNRFGNTSISTTQSKYSGSSIYFDGTGDYLQIAASSGDIILADFTIEGWIFMDDVNDRAIIDFDSASAIYVSSKILLWKDGIGQIFSTNTTDCPSNQWVHFAVCRSGSEVKLFQNGVLICTGNMPGNINFREKQIGARTYSNNFKGYMDNFRMTNIARYTANFDPNTATFMS